ncbi:beta-glucosidase [Penicillium lagena]|uniref:beta-glucosidase n=1 Tax=Penicillium lagena TaxID=94218 RepID=UPI0025413073|nr:beta-glucosidase [Penicillium lagena]KAJ5621133.1 beta-glucosidase [Penicillium lagena]
MHLMFADNIIGPNSDNALYDKALQPAPGAPIGIIHDWYPTNKSQYNELQKLNSERSRVNIPFIQSGECLHGVGSFKQSMFPQSIGMSASFDTNLVHRVGRAIGTEASSIGIHACFSPVLDLAKDPRWGRVQEDWGEDMVLTAHMGVAYASGLSKNSSWSDHDAVVPVMKHFAAHGSPQGGHNAAPFMGYGTREVLQEMLVPFKAAVELGGVKGVMMAYSEFDDVPSSVNPLLYEALADWGFDGYVTADDGGLSELLYTHQVTSSVADTIAQWHNAGGMVQYYDFPLQEYVDATVNLIGNGTLTKTTLQSLVRRILAVKYDLGLFDNPYIPEDVDSHAITASHVPLTLEAAQKSIVLLENHNSTLPIRPLQQDIRRIALIGPFSDIFNYGDYSGQWGGYPVKNASTIRQGILQHLSKEFPQTELLTSWGANTWTYNAQYNIPPYLLSANGTSGGLLATYYASPDFNDARFQKIETPSLDWGLYPPVGLPSNNFSVIWEGKVTVPVDSSIEGWFGVAVYPNTTAKLYIDGKLLVEAEATLSGNILSNIPGLSYTSVNSTVAPPGSAPFTFRKSATHDVRLEYQAWNYFQKVENVNSLNAQVLMFWNLVDQTDPIGKAVALAKTSDVIVLAVGANWNSDGESGDRATLELSPNQTALTNAIFDLKKPVILVLQGGRPFAIPEYYNRAAAVLNTFFPGQSGGQAISDVLFGTVNPGGRVPISVPYNVGTLPAFYNYKPSFPRDYTDIPYQPIYSFGYGLSYTEFKLSKFHAFANSTTNTRSKSQFNPHSVITFSVEITNTGSLAGSYTAQVYLLGRVSSITRPVRQLVAFSRAYLSAGETRIVTMDLDVSRYLVILDRRYNWTVESGDYTFALMENGGNLASTEMNVTLTCT